MIEYCRIYYANLLFSLFDSAIGRVCVNLCGTSDESDHLSYTMVPPEQLNCSVDPKYEEVPSNPVPGDLVITSLGDMMHPARRHTNFGNHFLILGAVVGFKGVNIDVVEAWKQGVKFKHYKNKERLYVDWMPVVSSNVRFIQISSKNRTTNYPPDHFENNFVAIKTTPPRYLHVVKKRTSGDLQDINDFLWQPIGRYFTWSSVYGWRYEPHRQAR